MITINVDKAKDIAHDIRRSRREKEFAPLDELVMKRIPGNNFDEVEQQRQAIRNKYEQMQNVIDSSQTVEEIKNAISS